jgi:hypothetical protein
MAMYLKTRLPHKHLLSSTITVECFQYNRPILSHLKPIRSRCYVNIPEEECSPGSKHLHRISEPIMVGYTASPKVYGVFTFEDEYVFIPRDLTFPKKSSPQVVITLCRISQDLEPDSGSTL